VAVQCALRRAVGEPALHIELYEHADYLPVNVDSLNITQRSIVKKFILPRSQSMKNMNLNAGGVVGGLLGAGAGAAYLYWKGDTQGRTGKLVVACVAGGAFVGNAVWGFVFPPKEVPTQAADAAAQNEATG
jgi:uncharacterized protein YcfJ